MNKFVCKCWCDILSVIDRLNACDRKIGLRLNFFTLEPFIAPSTTTKGTLACPIRQTKLKMGCVCGQNDGFESRKSSGCVCSLKLLQQ